jgi:membrane protein implicated in regulation of membrane protease activity
MKYRPNPDPARYLGSTTAESFVSVVAMSVLAILGIFAVVLALSYPTATAGVVAFAATGIIVVRMFRRFYRLQQRTGRTRQVCVPKVGVCVEV